MFDDFDPVRDRKRPSRRQGKPAPLALVFLVAGVIGGVAMLGWGLFVFAVELFSVALGDDWKLISFTEFLDLHMRGGVDAVRDRLAPFGAFLDAVPASPVLIFGGAALLLLAKDLAGSRRD